MTLSASPLFIGVNSSTTEDAEGRDPREEGLLLDDSRIVGIRIVPVWEWSLLVPKDR